MEKTPLELPISELRSQLSYDPESGKIFRLRAYNHFPAGRETGAHRGRGYYAIKINKRMYLFHRVAWALHYGEWPKHHVDHINGNPSDNRITNLRLADQSQNMGNRRISRNNKSGFKGVRKRTDCNRWEASLEVTGNAGRSNRKTHYLGSFKTPEEAHAAYVAAAKAYFGSYASAG